MINKVDKKLERLYARLPALDPVTINWLGRNLWWIVLVGSIVAIIGQLGIIKSFFIVASISGTYDGFWGFASIVALIYSIISIAILALLLISVGYLKRRSRTGWRILLIVVLLYFSTVSLYFIVNLAVPSLMTLLGALVSTSLGLYALYALKPLFTQIKKTPVQKPTSKSKTR